MSKLSTLLAASAAVVAATGVSAAVVSLDGFDTPFDPNPLATSGSMVTSMTTISTGGNTFDRTTTLEVDQNTNGPPSMASVRTDNGSAVFSNDTGVASILTFSYDVGDTFNMAQTGAATGSLRISELTADRPRTYTFSINGVEQSSSTQLIDTELGTQNDVFLTFSTAMLTGDDVFTVEIDAGAEAGAAFPGSPGSIGDALDLELAMFEIEIPELPPVDVPAPGALGLLGLGLLGIGLSRRRTAA
jgi:hypothetical protein|tara:strand:- start:27287 stop:28021 length:735 start_codon:yes stop_codon:yes gene_type:complete